MHSYINGQTTTLKFDGQDFHSVPLAPDEVQVYTKQDAELQYLRAVAPDIARKVEACARRWLQLADRARRAGLIVAAQGVEPHTGTSPAGVRYFARVRGRGEAHSGQDWYQVGQGVGSRFVCECRDWQDHRAPLAETVPGEVQRFCKHILAALLVESSHSSPSSQD